MGSYIPSTPQQRQEMLKAIGLSSFRELYGDVPAEMYLDRPLNIPSGMSELEVGRAVRAMADKNRVYDVILRGAGAYDHYIPSIVKYIPAKEEFLTAYTPYQAEMSQGLLQSIFEYQTMICMLTGMDVSNASVYDGATAAAEAAAMCWHSPPQSLPDPPNSYRLLHTSFPEWHIGLEKQFYLPAFKSPCCITSYPSGRNEQAIFLRESADQRQLF